MFNATITQIAPIDLVNYSVEYREGDAGTWYPLGTLLNVNLTNTTGLDNGSINISKDTSTIFHDRADWTINFSAVSGTSAMSVLATGVTMDNSAPNILLHSPANDTWFTTSEIVFNITAYDVSLINCTLWGNWTGSWVADTLNTTAITNGTTYSFTTLTLNNSKGGGYVWNARCQDIPGHNITAYSSGNYTVKVDASNPVVSLTNPSNATWDTDGKVYLEFSTIELNPDKCTLYGDFDGTWSANESKTYVNNTQTNFTVVTLAENNTGYHWNTYCNDTPGNYGWGSSNITVKVDASAPNITLQGPTNNTWSSNSSIIFKVTVIDTSLINCTLWGNWTGSWVANQTNLTSITNGTTYNFTTQRLSDGSYLWNVRCQDIPGHNRTAYTSGNFTLNIDTQTVTTYSQLNATDNYGHFLKASAASVKENFNSSTGYLRNASLINISVIISDPLLNLSNVTLYYSANSSKLASRFADPNEAGSTKSVLMTNTKNITATSYMFNASINTTEANLGNMNTTNFIIFATDLSGNDATINNSGQGFNITIDEEEPTPSITMPSTTSIVSISNIKITCRGSDRGSGVDQCTLKVTKPNGDTYTKIGCIEHELSGNDINIAGDYTADCSAVDNVGIESGGNIATGTFNVYYSGVEGGPTGDGGATADLSTSEAVTTTTQEGRILTVSLDGITIYDVIIKEVTSSTITITAADKDTTIATGESAEIDLDGDDISDAKATLDSITDGKARITFSRLAVEAIAEEEVVEEVVEEVAKKSLWWLWTLIALVVIVAAVVLIKKKKK
jgi:hypothetical protein